MKKKNINLKKTGRMFFLVLALSTVTYSCKKVEEKSPPSFPGHASVNTRSGDDLFYQNSSNPYDYVGAQHNEGLDYIRTNVLSWENYPENVDDSIRALTVRFAQNELETTQEAANNALNELDVYNDTPIDGTAFIEMVSSWNISSSAKGYMAALINAAYKYSDYDQLQVKINEIKNIEALILADNTLTTDESIMLLGGSSIARHSAYWWNQNPDPWAATSAPVGFPWFDVAHGSFTDVLAYMFLREDNRPIADSVVGAIGLSALGLAYLAYIF